jgi:hypothetical protein
MGKDGDGGAGVDLFVTMILIYQEKRREVIEQDSSSGKPDSE